MSASTDFCRRVLPTLTGCFGSIAPFATGSPETDVQLRAPPCTTIISFIGSRQRSSSIEVHMDSRSLEIESAVYDEFLDLWDLGIFKEQRLGQAFYNHFRLHHLTDQTALYLWRCARLPSLERVLQGFDQYLSPKIARLHTPIQYERNPAVASADRSLSTGWRK